MWRVKLGVLETWGESTRSDSGRSDTSAPWPGRFSSESVGQTGARVVRRVLDLALGLPLFAIAVPLIGILALAIRLDTPGPTFYRCRRVGLRGRTFDMLKLRKMVDGAAGPALTAANDARLTRCGRFLAATKLDELPQLWHVIRGQMSLVGPRPEDPAFVALYPDQYAEICSVKPGITGLCQLAFTRESAILGTGEGISSYVDRLLPAKVQIDLFYARERTLRMDLRILTWTAIALGLRKDVAVHRSSGRLSIRKRRAVQAQVAVQPGDSRC
jgi:lipopolysaccharide/colanic/teichoic acid biosynthesis glycosyltransferase